MNRLQQATIRGIFEDKFTKADMLLGTADQDYEGSKAVEEDVTEQTEIKLDYAARSLVLNLRTEAENITRVELVPRIPSHRVPSEQLEIYIRDGIGFTKLERTRWKGVKDSTGRITVTFTPLLEASEIKIHCNYDDLDFLQLPVDHAQFYNAPARLVTVYQKVTSRTETYQYDAMGNRTLEKRQMRKEYGFEYIYYPQSNRLKSKVSQDGSGRIDYAYDANGNLTAKTVTQGDTVTRWEYRYDLLNHLEEVAKDGATVSSYIYDPNGFRVEKWGSKGTIHYVPLINGETGYKKNLTTGQESSFIYLGNRKLARVDGSIGGSGKTYYYHNDLVGSALAITDEKGNLIKERDFAAFGEEIPTEDDSDNFEEESGFTGKDRDEDTGLYYYNARWYDPELGRFTSEDPAADPNNPNLYTYCANNPVRFVDPTGMDFDDNWGDDSLGYDGGLFGGDDNSYTFGGSFESLEDAFSWANSFDDPGESPFGDSGSDSDSNNSESLSNTINDIEPEQTITKQNEDEKEKNYSELSVTELLFEAVLLNDKLANLGEKAEKALSDPNVNLAEIQNLTNQLAEANKQAVDLANAFKERENEVREKIAKYAAELAGSKYVSGGSVKGKVDCRGTVYYSYNKAGVNLPNNTAQGYHDMMTPIEKSELQPGDIITYWNPTPKENGDHITHVQTYIGPGVESKTGKQVDDLVINASPTNNVYTVSLDRYLSWPETQKYTVEYGTLLK